MSIVQSSRETGLYLYVRMIIRIEWKKGRKSEHEYSIRQLSRKEKIQQQNKKMVQFLVVIVHNKNPADLEQKTDHSETQ